MDTEKLVARRDIYKYFLVGIGSGLATLFFVGGVLWYVRFVTPGFFFGTQTTPLPSEALDEPQSAPNTANSVLSSQEQAVINVVRRANPAVVSITISKNVPVYEQYIETIPSPFFDDFFGGDPFGGIRIPQLRQKGTELKEVGGGSGFFVSSDGYIVTNRHVVLDEDASYTVVTSDNKKYDAKVVARDPLLDIAVVKVEGSDFPHLVFGDSDTLEVGRTVIAIGNALSEFRNTVSVGVVSGLSRAITAANSQGGVEALDQLIQTDAAINPGNSGGPLLTLSGEVVGINVAVAGGAENIGFALSSNSVKNVIESVRRTGKIERAFLGVRYIPITEDIKTKNNLSVDYGVLVQRGTEPGDLAVVPGSPADKAGILENDIILEADGKKLTPDVSLAALVGAKKAGDTMTLKILSKGKERIVTVILEKRK